MFLYLLKCTIAMGVSWCIFRLLLATQKNFTFNRIYLLIAIIGSTLAPLITLPTIFKEISLNTSIPFISEFDYSNTVVESQNPAILESVNFNAYFQWIIIAISIMLAFRFVYKMIRTMRLSKGSFPHYKDGIRIAIIDDKRTPFSLFNVMYIDNDCYTEGIKDAIFLHEKYHIRAWHSMDRIVVELILILQWMNPFIYILKRDLIDNHEYAADAYAISQSDNTHAYLSLILKKVMPNPTKNFLLQQFSHSSSKKRIKMITTIQKNRQAWVYPLAILVLIACLISCSDDPYDKTMSEINNEENTSQVSELKKENKFLTKMGSPAPPPPPVPEIKRPSKRLLEKWTDNKTFGLLLDGEILDHQTLSKYTPDDISLFMVRVPHKKSKLFGKYKYEVQLLTNNGYNKFQLRLEKLQEEYYKVYSNGYVYKPNNKDGKK